MTKTTRPYQLTVKKEGAQWGWNIRHSNGEIFACGFGLTRKDAKAMGQKLVDALTLYDALPANVPVSLTMLKRGKKR